MKINEVELKNIRSYRDTGPIKLPPGTVLISGDVGSGKSSLLMGIEFALFGIRRGELTGGDLLTEGKRKGEVTLNFSVRGNDYEVHRELKRTSRGVGQESGYLIDENGKTELQPRELKARVFKILGYPLEMVRNQKSLIYRYTVYTPQEKMREIIEADDDDRLDILRKLFGINRYKRIMDNAGLVKTELRKKHDILSDRARNLDKIQDDKDELEDCIEKEEQELDVSTEEKREVKEKIRELKRDKDELSDELEKYHEAEKEKEGLKNNMENLKGIIHKTKENKEDNKEKLDELKKLERPTDYDLEEIENELEVLKKQKESYLKDEENIPEIQKELESQDELKYDIKGLTDDKQLLENKNKSIKDSLEELQEAGAECPVCGHELTDKHREEEIRKKRERIDEIDVKIAEVEKKITEKKATLDQLRSTIDVKKEEQVEKLDEEIKEKKSLKDELDTYMENMKEKEEIEEEIGELELDLKEKEDRKKELDNRIELITEEIEERKEVRSEIDEIEEQIEKKQQNLQNILGKIGELKSSINKDKEKVEEVEERISEKIKCKELADRCNSYQTWMDKYLVNLMFTIEKRYMASLQQRFDSYFDKWFNSLVDGSDLKVRIDDRFAPVITRDGYQTRFRRLCGGERTAVSLAYRLSLNKVMNILVEDIMTDNLIMLDEPTDGFSMEQLDKIRDVINELNFEQIILVSHEPKVEGYVDKVLSVQKEDGHSVVRRS